MFMVFFIHYYFVYPYFIENLYLIFSFKTRNIFILMTSLLVKITT